MTHHDELDRALVGFLSDDATRRVPASLFDGIVADTRTRPQQPGWLVMLRRESTGTRNPASARTRRLVLIAALAALAVLAAALIAGRQQTNPLRGGLLAYVRGGDVYLANPDGSQARVVLHQDGVVFSTVAWSATGNRLAIDGESGIILLNATTGSTRFVGGHDPAWSMDGRLALLVDPGGDQARLLRIVDPDTGATSVEYPFGAVNGLAWSPDGRWIAATGDCSGPLCPASGSSAANAVIRIDVSNGDVTQLDARSGHLDAERQVAWSPDSRHIAFIRWGAVGSRRCGDILSCSTDVVVADADGRNDRIVSRVPGQADQPAWSPDGTWLSFREVDRNTEQYRPASMGIVIQRSDGTAVRTLVVQPVEGYVWSSDSERLSFAVKEPGDSTAVIWEASLTGAARSLDITIDDGSTPFGLTGLGFDRQVVPSGATTPPLPSPAVAAPAASLDVRSPAPAAPADPTGVWSRLVTQSADGCELMSVTIGGGPATMIGDLCFPQPRESTGRWSPTGSAYATIRDGRLSIFHLDGRVDLNVDDMADLRDVAWSPDASWLTVTGVHSYVLRPDGSSRRELPGNQTTWSPDGRTIAVSRGDGQLLIGTAIGAAFTSVGTFPPPATWSPDGSGFGFIRDGDLWTAAIDGSDIRNVTSLPLGGASWAAWSPDGRWIAVLGHHGLWLVRPDGTEGRWLYMGLADVTTEAIWSPDSSRVAVQSYAESTDAGQLLRVYLVNVDGAPTIRLDATTYPRWSPDGRWLVATEARVTASGGWDPGSLVLMNADGSGRLALGTSELDAAAPTWVR
jgi:Tol biopolymer transport system component